MFTIDITQFTPKYLLADKNGYALAKAIETALNRMNAIIQRGINCIADYDTMPEWRLDELAWETNCLYDYKADVETKREWIRNALNYYIKYGTSVAIIRYLSATFESVDVEEFWQYGGDPYHFRVIVTGEWSQAADDWAQKAIAKTKNVRSVLDNILFNAGSASATLRIGAAVCGVDIEDSAAI